MFGHSYYGSGYYGPSYWGAGAGVTPTPPTPPTGGRRFKGKRAFRPNEIPVPLPELVYVEPRAYEATARTIVSMSVTARSEMEPHVGAVTRISVKSGMTAAYRGYAKAHTTIRVKASGHASFDADTKAETAANARVDGAVESDLWMDRPITEDELREVLDEIENPKP